jgi:hypothetical protein
MPTDNEDLYQILVPKEWKADLLESVSEAAQESKTPETAYEISEGDAKKAASELQFDPLLVGAGIFVANIVVKHVAGKLIDKSIDKLVQKVRALRKPAATKPILVLLPDGDLEELNPFDDAATKALIERLKQV